MKIIQTIPIGSNGQPETWSFDLSAQECQITIQNEAGIVIHTVNYPRPLFDGMVRVLGTSIDQTNI